MPEAGVGMDPRLDALRSWLAGVLGANRFTLRTASADASFRRYFRVRAGQRTWIAMDAPPPQEDVRPFIEVAALLRNAGVHAPMIEAADSAQGFLLLEDLGDTAYLDALDDADPDALMGDAIDALVAWQAASRPGVLPPYTAVELRRELALFPDWYLGRHLGVRLAPDEAEALQADFERIVAAARDQPQVFVHRDYMPRNLMVAAPNPGVIDFQDARYGPLAYDVLSLFKDAFVSWSEEVVEDWVARYWARAAGAGVPVPALDRLRSDLDRIGVQRHLKVLGIFARIRYRDGKPRYLEDAPRFVRYLRGELARLSGLHGVAHVVDRYLGEIG